MEDIVQTSRKDLQLVDSVLHGIICDLRNRPELDLDDTTKHITAARAGVAQAITSLNTASRYARIALDAEQQPPPQPLVARNIVTISPQPLVISNLVTESGRTSINAMTESGWVSYEGHSREHVPAPSGRIGKGRALGTDDTGRGSSTKTRLHQHDRSGDTLSPQQGCSSPAPRASARVEMEGTGPLPRQNRHVTPPSKANDASDLVKALSRERLNRQKEAHLSATTKHPDKKIQYRLGAGEWVSPKVGSVLGNVSSSELRVICEMWKRNIVPTKDMVQNQLKDESNRELHWS